MKPIDQMTLPEVKEEIEKYAFVIDNSRLYSLLDQLDELTRWIPVSERMPTEEDGYFIKWWIDDDREIGEALAYFPQPEVGYYHTPPKGATHWQRITPPEGV